MRNIIKPNKVRVLSNIIEEPVLEDYVTNKADLVVLDETYNNHKIHVLMGSDSETRFVNIDCNATETIFKQNENINLKFKVTDKKTNDLISGRTLSIYYNYGDKNDPILELIDSGLLIDGVFNLDYIEENLFNYDSVAKIEDVDLKASATFTVKILTEIICYRNDTGYNYVYTFFAEDDLTNAKIKLTDLPTVYYRDKNTGKMAVMYKDEESRYIVDKSKLGDEIVYIWSNELAAKGYYFDDIIIKLDKADYYINYETGKDDESVDGKTKDTAFRTLPYAFSKLSENTKTINLYSNQQPQTENGIIL